PRLAWSIEPPGLVSDTSPGGSIDHASRGAPPIAWHRSGMRVVAGSVGGRRLAVPRGVSTRPTSELVRGAVFNSLEARGVLDGASVADLFAGSGALGIEALSRGAAHVT